MSVCLSPLERSSWVPSESQATFHDDSVYAVATGVCVCCLLYLTHLLPTTTVAFRVSFRFAFFKPPRPSSVSLLLTLKGTAPEYVPCVLYDVAIGGNVRCALCRDSVGFRCGGIDGGVALTRFPRLVASKLHHRWYSVLAVHWSVENVSRIHLRLELLRLRDLLKLHPKRQ